MTVQQVKEASIGNWESIAAEVRPSNKKNADGTLKPFPVLETNIYALTDAVQAYRAVFHGSAERVVVRP